MSSAPTPSSAPLDPAEITARFAARARPFLRPGVRFGLYPQRRLAADERLERTLERLLLPLHPPRAARVRQWPAFLRELERYDRALRQLNEPDMERWIQALRRRLWRAHLSPENIACAFATVRELTQRTLGLRHHDQQVIAGWALLDGLLAEMVTGEGKTLTATLAACTAALAGIPVHIVTVNDYLARRDAELMAPIYRRFGLSVGVVTADVATRERRTAYAADITYCTSQQLVFDYLRDRLTLGGDVDELRLQLSALCTGERRTEQLLLRGLYFAIVDEADSIFVDEARTPLILAGAGGDNGFAEHYRPALWLAEQLQPGHDFTLDETARRIALTRNGARRLAEIGRPLGSVWADQRKREALTEQALAARHLYQRDRHYLVRNGRVEIIDEHTGRTLPDRSWEQGLQQMIEVKEGLPPSAPPQPLARISYQRFFQRYLRLAGMSGTLREVGGELRRVYGLSVVTVPRHRPSQLRTSGAHYFRRAADKWPAIVQAIQREHAAGRPVLVGTRTLVESEQLSALLNSAGVVHQILNARQDADEAAIVARAGQTAQVTIATNMAGRGTDIVLAEQVSARGGLHVILCAPNDSRRVDRQLIGRCARQGDPGSYEVFGSLEDDVIRLQLGNWPRWFTRRTVSMIPTWLGAGFVWLAQQLAEHRHRRARRALLRDDERRDERMAFSGRAE
ncbi:MAG: prepilin peptidase [Gammaproteobacteria bacterium]|nr:prepilin peptidase [Gammaproteobacteria bacterium]